MRMKEAAKKYAGSHPIRAAIVIIRAIIIIAIIIIAIIIIITAIIINIIVIIIAIITTIIIIIMIIGDTELDISKDELEFALMRFALAAGVPVLL